MLLKTNLGNTCANLFKSDYFKHGGQWSTEMKSSQDYNLMFGILQNNNNVVFEDTQNTVLIRRTSDSISHKNFKENWIRYIELRMKMLEYIKVHQPNVPMQDVYQILFDAIRIFYKHDKKLAIEYYRKIIPKNFAPSPTITTGRNYIRIYKLFGFRFTQWLKSLSSRVRNEEMTYG